MIVIISKFKSEAGHLTKKNAHFEGARKKESIEVSLLVIWCVRLSSGRKKITYPERLGKNLIWRKMCHVFISIWHSALHGILPKNKNDKVLK